MSSEIIDRRRGAWPWWRWALTGLSLLGLVLSAYLSWHYLVGGSVIGCGGGNPCDQVLHRRWSTIGGILPVSGLAAGAYLAMLLASFFIGPAMAAPDRRLAWSALLILVGAAAGSATWFIILQKWFIGAFCPYCMATHITGLVLAGLIIWRAPLQVDAAGDAPAEAAPGDVVAGGTPRRVMGRGLVIGMPMVGLALAGIMAACQFGFAPPPVVRGGQSTATLPPIEARAVPLVGSADATYIVTLLFDYRCPHCQQLHAMLDEAIKRYDGKLAFVLCPAPLNSQCNPYIPRDIAEFKDSCELAKIAMAVWVAKSEAFADFDRWLFSPEPGQLWYARSLDAARARAIELVGQAKFDAARADPWIDRYMQASVRIYGNTVNPDQSGNAVPKLVFGTRWVTPELSSVDELIEVLHSSLAVPRP